MTNYNFLFKVLLVGDLSVGKTSLVNKYMSGVFKISSRITIGVDFHTIRMEIRDLVVKLQFWLLAEQPRFQFLLPTFCKSASGAIIMFDITRSDSLLRIPNWIEMIHLYDGNVPIMLVGNKMDLNADREVTHEQIEILVEQYHLFGYKEISVKTGENVENMLKNFTEAVVDNYGSERRQRPPIRKIIIPEFEINKYLKLRLEYGKTIIYVNGKRFTQCKYLLFSIPTKKIRDYDEIRSIDEAAEKLDKRMETHTSYISPETEFWGHCSNLQAWYENSYDTRLLHRNLAFPLLKSLSDAGDTLAKRVFKEEIALRLESGYKSVVMYLINEGFLSYLNENEIDSLVQNPIFVRNLLKVYKSIKDVPVVLSKKILKHYKDRECLSLIETA
ncbi:MAG: Rab family GTPase [Candidatus Hermodarchaeota archaeon]